MFQSSMYSELSSYKIFLYIFFIKKKIILRIRAKMSLCAYIEHIHSYFIIIVLIRLTQTLVNGIKGAVKHVSKEKKIRFEFDGSLPLPACTCALHNFRKTVSEKIRLREGWRGREKIREGERIEATSCLTYCFRLHTIGASLS